MFLSHEDFDYIRTLVQRQSAIVLESEKAYLAETRLSVLARREGYETITALVAHLRNGSKNGLHKLVVEAMTNNETSFFRDLYPFEALRLKILPELLQRRAGERSLSIWCGACSSGQEPYSVAMLLHEHFPFLRGWSLRIIASDLSGDILERARLGRYTQLEVNRGLPARLLVKYFRKEGLDWQLRSEICSFVEFCPINLVDTWPILPPMDVILLRNVLIYFDVAAKKAVLAKVRRLLRPDGYLFLGGAETTLNLDATFERVQLDRTGCYRLAKK